MNSLLDENTQGPILTSREVRKRCIELEKAMMDLKEEYRSFVHIMAHDIRGCFNAVLGYAQLLKEVHNPEYADTIVESVHRMTRLLDRSVRLADLGVPVSWLSEVDLNRVIPAVASSVLPADVVSSSRARGNRTTTSAIQITSMLMAKKRASHRGKARNLRIRTTTMTSDKSP